MASILTAPTESVFDRIADALVARGYILLNDGPDAGITRALYERTQQLSDDFRRAGVGREQDQHLNSRIRQDEIHWLSMKNPAEVAYLEWMETLREEINRRLFMGLFDYECHFAHYAPGAFYRRHLDAFRGQTNRVLTTVYYLNDGWQKEDGGELLLYPDAGDEPIERVLPTAGTLVIFLSDSFPHEVLPAKADRYSIAGWFRVNGSLGNQIDPPR